MKPEIYDLKYPIVRTFRPADGPERQEAVTSITIRPPKGKDLRVIDKHVGSVAQTSP